MPRGRRVSHVIAAFAAGGVERQAARRRGMAAAGPLAPGARVLGLWSGQIPLGADGALVLTGAGAAAEAAELVYLGRAGALGEVLALDLDPDEPAPPLPPGAAWSDLRQIMAQLSAPEAELAATAKAVLSWHRTHRYCSACGQPSRMAEAGWQRRCPACGTAHFPRTDPVVIMLVTRGERLLLGRSPGWPEGMYSTLAGFMEPGETVEAAVRREVAEETGIVVGEVRYVSSQPWPFPASLMLGCHGTALSEAITLDPVELEDALWLTRQDMVAVLAGQHPRVRAPRSGSIAHALLVNWLADRIR
ncbi:MAG: NAD(+) diphosphatase [Paracoccaceae bacterium]